MMLIKKKIPKNENPDKIISFLVKIIDFNNQQKCGELIKW